MECGVWTGITALKLPFQVNYRILTKRKGDFL